MMRPKAAGRVTGRGRARARGEEGKAAVPGGKDDETLIAAFKRGETDAFQSLVAKYSNLVGSIAYNIIGDVHIASDITQDTFLKVYRNLYALEDPRKFKGWLCSIVRTTCIDFLRKEKFRPASLEKIAEDGLEPETKIIGGLVEGPHTELEELRERVLEGINALPRIYQQILLLRHLRKMSYREMSHFLSVPVATIESRLYRARLMLKEKLLDLYA
jgi:RNA polymerase sigma-70 factor (ECF subfamily)